MHLVFRRVAILGAVGLCLGMMGCRKLVAPAIVGTWLVQIPEAPFPWHMFVFHADGTVEQSNPDAGDPHTSDSNLMGAWKVEGDHVRGKIVEISADRTTHAFVSRGEIAFTAVVTGDSLRGDATAVFYGVDEKPLRGAVTASLKGRRVVP